MKFKKETIGLYTDHYELTMCQGHYMSQRHNTQSSFDYFFRKNPFDGGYTVFYGLDELLDAIQAFKYPQESLDYLKKIGFNEDFLTYLSNFSFQGKIYAPREGTLVFPNEPVLRLEGTILECQILETIVLNMLNYPSLIATKASRMRNTAGPDSSLIDFGLRRAPGFAGVQASKAAIAGGFISTSNVYAAELHDIESTGTQAHAWIQSFDDELTSFREFAKAFPNKCILLVDTYDTLKSGIPNAIKVAREMEERGDKLFGVRLDSGDLGELAKKSRKLLDDAGFKDVKIVISDQVDEFMIKDIIESGSPVDGYGVGTNLVTGRPDAALDGVYKLTEFDQVPRLKLSENEEKIIWPGRKDLLRIFENGKMQFDAICKAGEDLQERYINTKNEIETFYLPQQDDAIRLHQLVYENEEKLTETSHPKQVSEYVSHQLDTLPDRFKRLENADQYPVTASESLVDLRKSHIKQQREKIEELQKETI